MRGKADFDDFSTKNLELTKSDWYEIANGETAMIRNIDCDLLFDRNPEIEDDIKKLKEMGVSVFLRVKV